MNYYPNITKQNEFLTQILELNPYSRILDIGSEDGKHLLELQKTSPTIYGIDVAQPNKEYPNFILGSAFTSELPTDLDGVYIMSPFFGDKWNDYDELFSTLSKNIVKDGKLIFDLFNYNAFQKGGGFKNYIVKEDRVVLSNFVKFEDRMQCERTIVFKDWSQKSFLLNWKVISKIQLMKLSEKYGFALQNVYQDFDVDQVVDLDKVNNKKRNIAVFVKI